MTRRTIAIALALLLSLFLFLQVRGCQKDKQALSGAKNAIEAHKDADNATAVADSRHTTYRKETQTRATEREQRTSAALEANPDWADQPVPPDVIASLRD